MCGSGKTIDDYLWEILDYSSNSINSILDVGCGSNMFLYRNALTIGIDARTDLVNFYEGRRPFIKCDMLNMSKIFKPKTFDICIFKDSLEHVEKEQAKSVIKVAFSIARVGVLVFMPEGNVGDNPWDEGLNKHKFHPSDQDCRDFGFTIINRLMNYHGKGKNAFLCSSIDDYLWESVK